MSNALNNALRGVPPSSRGLGHLPFTEATGIRIPLGVLKKRGKSSTLASLFSFLQSAADGSFADCDRKQFTLSDLRVQITIRSQEREILYRRINAIGSSATQPNLEFVRTSKCKCGCTVLGDPVCPTFPTTVPRLITCPTLTLMVAN